MNGELKIDLKGLEPLVESVISRSKEFDPQTASNSNLIDPLAAGMEAVLLGYSSKEDWHAAEHLRLKQKHLANSIGDLQQAMIGLLPGWTAHATGTGMPDVVGNRGSQKIIAEIKNKHNTMNSKSSAATYDELEKFLNRSEFKDYIALVVTMISPPARGSYWRNFFPGDKEQRDDIIIMNGRVFYAIATDPQNRVPNISIGPEEDLSQWETWNAIDKILDSFWKELEKQTGEVIPDWVKALTNQAFG